jgi:uncharacterized protein involved in exopolysaccharide biosynthesis
MYMDNLDKYTTDQEQEIDLIELVKKIWSRRRLVLKACGIAVIVALVVAFSMPKTYTTTVILAPISKPSSKASNMGQLAAMAGVNLQPQDMQDLAPEVYPDVMESTPFLMGLFDIPVKDKKQDINTSLYTYLDEYQKKAWWSYIKSAPFKLLGLFLSKDDDEKIEAVGDVGNSQVLAISKKQARIVAALKNRINISVEKKTGVITLSSAMQSPAISAVVADTVISYMQDYIIGYRTKKALQDLDFTEKLYQEAKNNYYKSQQAYAAYTDENIGIISARYRTTQERLQNEMSLAYGLYNQMAQQLQMAKIKVQDMKPVYAVVQPAVVPLKASSPRKMLILVGCVFLAFVGACGWILVEENFTTLTNK